jgi:hypothetical protein
VLKTDAFALRAKRHEMGRPEHAMSVVPTPCSSPSWNPPIAFTIDPPPAAASGRGLCASRAPASHTAATPALPPRREALADGPSQGDEGSSPDCLCIHAGERRTDHRRRHYSISRAISQKRRTAPTSGPHCMDALAGGSSSSRFKCE